MNKLLTILFLLFALTSFGQTNVFNVGVEAGPSLASLRGKNQGIKQDQIRIGYSAGLVVQYNFSKLLSLCSGTYYEVKGSYEDILLGGNGTRPSDEIINIKGLKYLTIPILLRVNFRSAINCYINTGPYFGILLQEEDFGDYNPFTQGGDFGTRYYKKTEIGIEAGAGISGDLSPNCLISFELRDNFGLTDISAFTDLDRVATINYSIGTIKTNAFYLLVGVSHKLGEKK